MAIALLDLVGKALRVAKQALGKHAGKPESDGLARETHIVAHCIRKEEGHTYTELIDRLSLMPEVCERLGLHPDALPDPTHPLSLNDSARTAAATPVRVHETIWTDGFTSSAKN